MVNLRFLALSNRRQIEQELVLSISLTRGWRIPMESRTVCCYIALGLPGQSCASAMSPASREIQSDTMGPFSSGRPISDNEESRRKK